MKARSVWLAVGGTVAVVSLFQSSQVVHAGLWRQAYQGQKRGGAKVSTPLSERGKPGKDEPFAVSGVRSQITKPRNVVARDAKAFAGLWAEHAKSYDGAAPPSPKVDFKKMDVIGVFLGSLPTGGHSVEIGEIKRNTKKAVVKATHTTPGPGTLVIQAFTSPFAMKAVPKLPTVVTFEIAIVERK